MELPIANSPMHPIAIGSGPIYLASSDPQSGELDRRTNAECVYLRASAYICGK